MKKLLLSIAVVMCFWGCQKDEEEQAVNNVTYKAICDSCLVTYWVYRDGVANAVDTVVKSGIEYSFVSDAPRNLGISIKNNITDTVPVSVFILVRGTVVSEKTMNAVRFGAVEAGKNWPYASYLLE